MFSPKALFSAEQIKQIEAAIQLAEQRTSGEIRVYIDKHCREKDVVASAQKVFHKIGMDKTALANGVLFYFAVNEKQFAIVGDKGINDNVTSAFWDLLRDEMQQRFSKGQFTEGLCNAIEKTGTELKKYFPISTDDKNELSNEVMIDNEPI
jgi:uncharacterized membrane protein